MMSGHQPVMVNELIELIATDPDGIYVDATFGAGGHARALLERLSPRAYLIAFDMHPIAEQFLPDDPRIVFIRHNFAYAPNYLDWLEVKGKITAIYADLGLSSILVDDPRYGFSYRHTSILDMRFDPDLPYNAAYLCNRLSAEELERIFAELGELPRASRLARLIVETRELSPIRTTTQLVRLISTAYGRTRAHRLVAQAFQALRIAVNRELEALHCLLSSASSLLKVGGRIAVISYHSLEDRLVKQSFKNDKKLKVLTPKPLTPSREEIKSNPRSRSARLRAAEKVAEK